MSALPYFSCYPGMGKGPVRRKQQRPGIALNDNTLQPHEAVQTQRNETILQRDTPAQKTKLSYTGLAVCKAASSSM